MPGVGMRLTGDEARGVMLAAQGLWRAGAGRQGEKREVTGDDLLAMIERLGVVQVDTISVVERTQYLTLWSRLGAYDVAAFDALLYPRRAVFEYWSHAASIIPMVDWRYYRGSMLQAEEHMWPNARRWMQENPEALRETLEMIRARGPMASADFERVAGASRTGPWDWYGPKESRRALDALWTSGELMIHSRRNGQKVYELRERALAEVFGAELPRDDALPTADERVRYLAGRTIRALGVVTPSWLWDYFRLSGLLKRTTFAQGKSARAAAKALLDGLCAEDGAALRRVEVEGLEEPVYLAGERWAEVERVRDGARPQGTTLLSPFDSLIWDRGRARALFGYEVVFEAYVAPEKRRYGYYSLAILHDGRLVGRLDAKAQRGESLLLVRALYLEPDCRHDDGLLHGLSEALRDLARFLRLQAVVVRAERCEPEGFAAALEAWVG